MNMLCSDKTGTLTKNKMAIQPDAPTYAPNLTQLDLLRYAAMAAKWESPPKDALDTLVLRCPLWGQAPHPHSADSGNAPDASAEQHCWTEERLAEAVVEALKDFERLDFKPFHATTKRTESTIRQKST
eukprot:EG_transcript_49634